MSSSLSRAQSWPLLVQAAGGGGATSAGGGTTHKPPPPASPKAPVEPRRLLRRHYYPEGGWGWVVLIASTLVQILNHGLQLSAGVLLVPTAQRFGAAISEAGNQHYYNMRNIPTRARASFHFYVVGCVK